MEKIDKEIAQMSVFNEKSDLGNEEMGGKF